MTAFKLGSLFSGGVLIYFMDWISSISSAFLTLSITYLIFFLILYAILDKTNQTNENNTDDKDLNNTLSFKEQLIMLHKSPGTYWICIYVLIYKLGEQSSLNMLPMYLVDKNVSSKTIGFWTGILGQTFSILGSLLSGFILKKTNQTYSTHFWLKISTLIRIIPIIIITFILISFENSKQTNLSNSYSLGKYIYLNIIN